MSKENINAQMPEGSTPLTEVHVLRYLDEEGHECISVDYEGHMQEPGPVELLGMLAVANSYVLASLDSDVTEIVDDGEDD